MTNTLKKLVAEKSWDEAYKFLLKVSESDYEKTLTLSILAWKTCVAIGNAKEAEVWLDNALAIDSTVPSLLRAKADCHARRNEWRLAVSFYQKAVDARPDIASFHAALGNAFEKIDLIDQAIECFERALEISEQPSWVLKLATCLVSAKEPREALAVLIKFNSSFNHEVLNRKAQELEMTLRDVP